MIAGFLGVIYAGHVPLVFLVLGLQVCTACCLNLCLFEVSEYAVCLPATELLAAAAVQCCRAFCATCEVVVFLVLALPGWVTGPQLC
jgi:hypothetical protein